jgi:hypothetical protein
VAFDGALSEGLVIEFPSVTVDPIGNLHTFLQNCPEKSVAYYVA